MSDPLGDRAQLEQVLQLAASEARAYLAEIDSAHVLGPGAEDAVRGWSDPMPADGDGARGRSRGRAVPASSTS